MKIRVTETEIEAAHEWIDADDHRQATVLRLHQGDELDTETLDVGDPQRLVSRLVRLGYAVEV